MSIDLTVKIGKLKLKTPFICASGTFGYGTELKGLADFSSLGAFVTKTITLDARTGNPPPRISEVECGMLNSIGLENPGVDTFIREKLPVIAALKVPFLVSIGGHEKEQYKDLVRRLDTVGRIKAFEVNLSCPNLRMKKLFSQSAGHTYELVKILRALTDKTLVVKVTGETDDIVKIAKAVYDAGADAVSLVNTFFGMAIDIETQKPRLGSVYGGYSGKGIKPLSLYRVWQVARSIDIPVIGGGGVTSPEDAVEFLLAGARAVSVGTVLFNDPAVTADMVRVLKEYMKKKKIRSLSGFRGLLRQGS